MTLHPLRDYRSLRLSRFARHPPTALSPSTVRPALTPEYQQSTMNTESYVISAVAFALLSSGCASRSVPASFPSTSAASASAPEASRTSVTRALDEDPPLPGASTEGWPGLRPAAEPAAGGHEQHAGGHEQHRGQKPGDTPADHSGHGAPPAARPTGTSDSAPPLPAATYSCPMHPEVVSDHEGRCPKCGMALERQP